MTQAQLIAMLEPIAAQFPAIPDAPAVSAPRHPAFIARTAFDMSLVLARLDGSGAVVDIGGGIGLFSLGMAKLGIRSLLLDDFLLFEDVPYRAQLFELFELYGVEAGQRDVIRDGLGLEGEKVSAVTSFHVLEHLHDSPRPMLHSAVAALEPGGSLVLAGPNCVNLRKRLTVPAGRGKWSTMEQWYETQHFRGHVREPDLDDFRHIASDLGLREVAVYGRNYLGLTSTRPWAQHVTRVLDRPLRLRPSLCSDLYVVGRK